MPIVNQPACSPLSMPYSGRSGASACRMRRRLAHLLRRDADLDPTGVVEQLSQVAFAQQAAAVDDADDVGQQLDLVQQVARDDDGLAQLRR